MTVFQVKNLFLSYDGTPILSDVSVTLGAGARAALVGPNGAGKTSLLRVILGEVVPARGSVSWAAMPRIGYVPQNWEFDDSRSPLDLIGYEKAAVLGQCGIGKPLWDLPCRSLSGGERTRLSLALALAGDPELLILDEPTNHLDANARDCVEEALCSFPGALLVATHDRYFLDRVCNIIWSVEAGRIRVTEGNYSVFRKEARSAKAPGGPEQADNAMRELGLQAEIAYIVSRISTAKDAADKADLERQYSATLEKLKTLRQSIV